MPEKTIGDPSIGLQEIGQMSLVAHLEDLRRRLIICCIAIVLTSSISYVYAAEILHLITAPAGKLYYMNPTEAFFAYIQISVFTGFLVALPLLMFEIWTFLVPALTKQEQKASILLVPLSVVLFFLGLAFSYYLALPAGIKFFLGFATEDLQPLFSLGQYLSFVISFLLPFGLVFELPLFIIILAKLGVISSVFLVEKRKTMLVLAFVIGAVIAPTPDVFSQIMIAVPIILLYEMSVIIVKYTLHK